MRAAILCQYLHPDRLGAHMLLSKNARIAGFALLFYIAIGIASMILFSQATSGAGIAAKFANISHHVFQIRITILLGLLQAMCAMTLGVTLYRITREQDPDLALLALTFRVGEGLISAISIRGTLELLWLATSAGPKAPDTITAQVLGAYLLNGPGSNMAAVFFAIGSTLFSYLFLRGRTIPVALAWLGVFASVLLLVGLPLQVAGFLSGPITAFMWIPMALFELPLGFLLIIKGVSRKKQLGSL
jgi:hypothetical protein